MPLAGGYTVDTTSNVINEPVSDLIPEAGIYASRLRLARMIRPDVSSANVVKVEAAGSAAAFNERQNHVLVGRAATARFGLAF